MRTALVHDYLVNMGGAERVLEKLLDIFPDAPIYTSIYKKGSVSSKIESHEIKTSFLQNIPGAKSRWQYLLPLMPRAFESFNLESYDLVVSSSHSCAKGIIVRPTARHICYCHTPMRYAFNLHDEYLETLRWPVRPLFAMTMRRLRKWDLENSKRVDHFIANSTAVAERIKEYYARDAEVIFPPVDTEYFTSDVNHKPSREYYLIVARFTPYKRVDIAIDACERTGRALKVVGSAKGYGRGYEKEGRQPSTEFLGEVDGERLRDLYRNARAFLMPADEDFGITTVEAQACSTPVIAYRSGGALDTVIEGKTGMFFERQDAASLARAIGSFEKMSFDEVDIREHARTFSAQAFTDRFQAALSLFISESAFLPFGQEVL